jgi:hypothetical protein
MALGSTQLLTEISTRNFPGGGGGVKGGRRVADCLEDVGASTPHTPMGFRGLLQR